MSICVLSEKSKFQKDSGTKHINSKYFIQDLINYIGSIFANVRIKLNVNFFVLLGLLSSTNDFFSGIQFSKRKKR